MTRPPIPLPDAVAPHAVQIAIDGPAASGKSTVGLGLARRIGCSYLDTGLMYRAITARALQRGISPGDAPTLRRLAEESSFELGGAPGVVLMNGQPLGEDLHSAEIDASVSQVAAHPDVREVLVDRQRHLGNEHSIVMVGRDIGTVVLPHARVKLWLTASEEERARRRQQERPSGAAEVWRNDLRTRDAKDSTRLASPLRKADDAIVIETDGLSREETIAAAFAIVLARTGPQVHPSP